MIKFVPVIRDFLVSSTLLIASALTVGCAEMNSIHDQYQIPKGGQILTVDAKQRHFVMVPEAADGKSNLRVCAEAAPDVFSTYALSLAAKGGKNATGFGAELGMGSSETAATIERTQTVNMLRESMYRTCERYASGAINRTQLVIQAARDQRVMVAILAIEQLTGALRPRSTIIAPPGTSASVFSGEAAAKLLMDSRDRRDRAQKAADDARAAVDSSAACKKSETDKDKVVDPTACDALKAQQTTAEGNLKTAKDELAETEKKIDSLVASANAATSSGTSQQGGGVARSDVDDTAIEKIANKVVRIQAQSQIDEALMYCIGVLSDPDAMSVKTTKKYDAQGKVASEVISSSIANAVDCASIIKDRAKKDEQIKDEIFSALQKPEVQNEVRTRTLSYEEFLNTVREKLGAASDEADFKRRRDALGAAAKPSSPFIKKCSTKAKCLAWLGDKKESPLRADLTKPDFTEKWSKALSEM